MGEYETLLEQPVAVGSGILFVCFTDDPTLVSETWQVRYVEPIFGRDPIRSARAIKIRGHLSLAEYDETLWIDNTVLLLVDPAVLFDTWLDGVDLAIPTHSYRDTVEGEFQAVAASRKDDPARVYEQLMHYRALAPDLLKERPLWTALIARRRSPEVQRSMEIWLGNVLRYSRRDQLSVVMALASATYPIARIEIDNLESRWHRWPMAVGRRQPVGEPTPDESSLAAEVARLRRVIDAQTFHYTDAVVAREDSLRAMTESHSWRVTAPLRWATTSLRLLRGRIRR